MCALLPVCYSADEAIRKGIVACVCSVDCMNVQTLRAVSTGIKLRSSPVCLRGVTYGYTERSLVDTLKNNNTLKLQLLPMAVGR